MTPHDTTVCQGSRVILRASGSSNYTWSDGHQGARDTIAALTAGVYIVSGIASAGCTATDTARIHIYAPVANITQSSGGPCRTDSTTLTATGGSSYTWSNLAHTAAITVAPATTTIYTVSISDAHGCTATSSATVQPHTTHRWDIAVTTVPPPCPGQNQGSIYLSVPTGSNYNYSWNTGSTLPNINALAAGHYYATVSDNLGCDTVISVQLNYMNTPIVAVTPSDTTVCPGSTVILSATSGLTDYQWSDGHLGRRDTISVTTSGSYVVSATASPGCYAHDTAIIRLYTTPSVTIAVTAPPSCSVDSTILTAAGGGLYHWNNGAQTGTIHVSPATATTYTVTVSDAHHCTASASATALPASGHLWGLSATTIDPPCPGQNQGSIFLSVPPGVSYHYAWNTGATQPNIQNLGAGNYRVTITDNAGCDTILTAHLSYQTIPIITISPSDTTVCPGEAVTLAATSGFSGYQWSDGHQGQWDTVIVSIGGSYSVSATASPGCFARDTATIRLYSPPSAAIATSVPGLCPSDSATLTGTGGIAFHWSTGEQTATIKTSPPAVTTYTLTVTDGHGCTDTAMVTLAGHPRHLWLLSDIESAPYCQGVNNGSITIQPPPGSSYHYLWNTGDTLVHMDSLGSGSFHLIITDSLRCDTALYFHLAYQYIPMVVISPADTIVCPGSVVYLSATPGFSTYLWTDLTRSMTDTITVLGPGRYSVIATDLQGCQASDTADISLYPLPVAHISELATGHCTTDSIILRADGGITYSWSTGSISDSVKTLPQGVYSVTVADGHGCTASDTITPQGTSIPWAFTAIYSLPPCPQSTNGQIGINVMDSKPISYLWNTGDTSALISGLTAGTYSVTLAEAPLCDTVLSFAVTYAYSLGISLYPSDTAIYAGAPLQLQAITTTDHGNNYSWIPASGLSCTTCTDPYVWVGTSTSSYIVQVTDKNGCTASDTMYIHVRVPPSIYIPNVFSPNSDGINDFFQIFTSGVTHESVSQFYIEIFDRWGEKVFETNDSEFMWDGVYKGNPMPPGVYVYVAQYSLTGEERSIINKGSLTLIR